MHYYFNLFVNTRKTIEAIDSGTVRHQMFVPYLIVSATAAFPAFLGIEDGFGEGYILGFMTFVSVMVLSYILCAYVCPGLYLGVSRFFGGAADFKNLQVTLSLVLIPYIALSLNQFLKALIAGTMELPEPSPLLELIVHLLSFKIMVVGLAHYNKITYHKAFVLMLASMIFLTLIYGLFTM